MCKGWMLSGVCDDCKTVGNVSIGVAWLVVAVDGSTVDAILLLSSWDDWAEPHNNKCNTQQHNINLYYYTYIMCPMYMYRYISIVPDVLTHLLV